MKKMEYNYENPFEVTRTRVESYENGKLVSSTDISTSTGNSVKSCLGCSMGCLIWFLVCAVLLALFGAIVFFLGENILSFFKGLG